MRILVVSLLRIGDLLLAGPALATLRKQHPRARIDVLVNRDCAQLAELFTGVDRFIYFERNLYQESLTSVDQPVLEAFYRLDCQVRELKAQDYNLVVNLTQNRLSGYLCGAISTQESMGLKCDFQGAWSFGSPWFQYLNERSERRGEPMFHYCDIFSFGASGQSGWGSAYLRETSSGQKEAAPFSAGALVIQLFTSDEKKNWGEDRWRDFLASLLQSAAIDGGVPVVFLSSPQEREAVSTFVDSLKPLHLNTQMAVVSLAAAYSILKRARLLISGDTSIKHLAVAADCPVVELALGGSDPWRTGAYQEEAIILQPKTSCSPCVHSLPCGRAKKECAMDLDPHVVASVVAAKLTGQASEIEQIAEEQVSKLRVIRVLRSSANYWLGLEMGQSAKPKQIQFWLDQLAHKMALEGQNLNGIGSFGTEARRLFEWIRRYFPKLDAAGFSVVCQALEREAVDRRRESQDAKQRLRGLISNVRDQSFVEIEEMRKIQKFVESVDHRLGIRGRLIRSIQESVQEVL